MRQSAYKDILEFLIKTSQIAAQGNHLRRLQSMASLVHGCLKSKQCTVEGMSQPRCAGQICKKNTLLQEAKRWLGNKWVDWEAFYLPMAKRFLRMAACRGELIFVIDGSQTGAEHISLMLSVLCRGFALPLVWLVKEGEKGHFPEQMHLDLLQVLLPIVPQDCRKVFLGDGEFDGQKVLQWCAEQGWEFVLRTACDRQVDCGGETARIDSLAPAKGDRTVFLSNALGGFNAVCWHGKRFEKPIFLLTNMDVGSMACACYRKRFKIEAMFKNLKSKGFQLHKTQIKNADKIARLILIVATAFVLTFCLGCFAKHKIPTNQLQTFVRKDKIKKMGPIHLAQKCWDEAFLIALVFFSELSKNFDWVFS